MDTSLHTGQLYGEVCASNDACMHCVCSLSACGQPSPDLLGLLDRNKAMLLAGDTAVSYDAYHPHHLLCSGALQRTCWQIAQCCEHLTITHTHTQTPRQSWYWCHSMKMFVAQVERLQRDTDQYTSYAMAAFSAAVEAAVPLLLQKVCFATCPSMLASRHPQHTVHIFYMYSCCSITAYQARSDAGCCHSNANIDTCLIS